MSYVVNPFIFAAAPPGPDTIADLELWLKADAITGLSDSDPITTWADSSGNGRDATSSGGNRPLYRASGGANNLPYVEFNGTSHEFSLPNFLTGFTEGEQFVVIKVDADPSTATTGAAFFNRFGSSATSRDIYPHTDGIVYDGFASTTRWTTDDPSVALTSWRLYEARSKAGEWTNTVDGTQLWTSATNTVGFGATPKIGVTDTLRRLKGHAQEGIFFSRVVNGTERQAVRDYVAYKYALTIA